MLFGGTIHQPNAVLLELQQALKYSPPLPVFTSLSFADEDL